MIFKDVVCPFCTLNCDDNLVELTASGLRSIDSHCSALQSHFTSINSAHDRQFRVAGKPASLKESLKVTRDLLDDSLAPLIFGMSRIGVASQRSLIQLAERLNARITGTGDRLSAATTQAEMQRGLTTCSLGEVKQRADVVIFWGCNPAKTHPRLLSKIQPRDGRITEYVVIGDECTETVAQYRPQIVVNPVAPLELIQTLRSLVRKTPQNCGVNRLKELSLAEKITTLITQSQYVVMFYGSEFTNCEASGLLVEKLFTLGEELCATRRCAIIPLKESTTEHVLTWQTGCSDFINFANGTPEREEAQSLSTVLKTELVDCCLIVGSNPLKNLDESCVSSLKRMKTIWLSPLGGSPDFTPTVEIPIAVDGIHLRDSVFRFDGLALPVRKLVETSYPSVSQVVDSLSAMPVELRESQR